MPSEPPPPWRAQQILSFSRHPRWQTKTHTIFSNYETTYTFDSDFNESKLGHGDSLYNDFSYDHRFLITGKWYLRLGVEYERYDFGGTDNGLPDHLQALMATWRWNTL